METYSSILILIIYKKKRRRERTKTACAVQFHCTIRCVNDIEYIRIYNIIHFMTRDLNVLMKKFNIKIVFLY